MLSGIAEGASLMQLKERTAMSRRELLEQLEELEKDGYDTDALIQLELNAVPEEEQKSIWKAFEELGDTFLKPVLQRVYGQEADGTSTTEQLYERLRLIRIRYRRSAGGADSRNSDRQRNVG